MKPRGFLLLVIAGVVLATAPGCMKIWQKNLDIKTYLIQAERTAPRLEAPIAGKLWVDRVHVLPPFNVRNLIMQKSEVEYVTSYYTELLMSPAENFERSFFAWMSDSGIFEYVSVSDRSSMTHCLSVSVMELCGDMADQSASLKIQVTLMDENRKNRRVLFSRTYERKVEVSSVEANQLILAYNYALTKILEDCEADIIAALRDNGESGLKDS